MKLLKEAFENNKAYCHHKDTKVLSRNGYTVVEYFGRAFIKKNNNNNKIFFSLAGAPSSITIKRMLNSILGIKVFTRKNQHFYVDCWGRMHRIDPQQWVEVERP